MRETYDVVIIGGGHNGLIAAIECAKAGLSTGLLEAAHAVGGCAITTEPLLPGFRHSPHANSLIFVDLLPPSFTPTNLGVDLFQPEAQFGVAFADGRPPVILHRPDLLPATRASLAAYSDADALTYVRMKRRSADLGPLLRKGLYTPPDAAWFDAQSRAVARAFAPFCRAADLGRRTARQLIDELFETAEIRILLYALAIETGVGLEDPGSDLAFLSYSLWIAGRWRVPVGGMQAYADALLAAARAAGAEVLVATAVERILVSDGRAVGVRTGDGHEIGARLSVVAATPILKLFDDLVPADQVSPAERAELEAFRRTSSPSIGAVACCLDWTPRYTSGRHDPQIDRCLKTVVGFDMPSQVLEQASDVRAGRLPRPAGVVRVHSLWDRTLAPDGSHIAAVDASFPALPSMDSSTWRHVGAAFPMALFDTWQDHLVQAHAPPPMVMTFDDALGFERRMLLRLGEAQYRTSVRDLYLAGPGVYPGGGVHGACGYNAAMTAVADQRRRA